MFCLSVLMVFLFSVLIIDFLFPCFTFCFIWSIRVPLFVVKHFELYERCNTNYVSSHYFAGLFQTSGHLGQQNFSIKRTMMLIKLRSEKFNSISSTAYNLFRLSCFLYLDIHSKSPCWGHKSHQFLISVPPIDWQKQLRFLKWIRQRFPSRYNFRWLASR